MTYWLGHIGQYFKGGYSGSGENGVDITLPQDTPVYAFTSGTVKGAGYYGGGGVVSIQAQPGTVWYYQHLDQNVVQQGDTVQQGQLIGYSGGQNTGGAHNASPTYSSWPHIEVGINAPWGGIWGGGEGPNINPLPYLQQLAPGLSQYMTLSSSNTGQTGLSNPLSGIGDAFQHVNDFFGTIQGWFTPPTRALKFVAGLGLMFLSLAVVFLPDIAAGAAAATGNPEVGAAILSANKGPKGVAGAGIRALGNVAGRQRTANKQAVRAERAANTATLTLHPTSERAQNLRTEQAQAAQARTLERTQRVERAQTTVNLLNKRIARYSGGTRSSGPGNLATPSTARPVPSSPPTDFSVPKAGHLGPLHKNVPADKNRKAPPRPQQPTALPTATKQQQKHVAKVMRQNPGGRVVPVTTPAREVVGRTVRTKRPVLREQYDRVVRLIQRPQRPLTMDEIAKQSTPKRARQFEQARNVAKKTRTRGDYFKPIEPGKGGKGMEGLIPPKEKP